MSEKHFIVVAMVNESKPVGKMLSNAQDGGSCDVEKQVETLSLGGWFRKPVRAVIGCHLHNTTRLERRVAEG